MSNKMKVVLFVACCIMSIGCDRITKTMAKEHLQGKEQLSYFNDTFRLLYVENTGAALSMGDDLPKTASLWLLSILPLAILLLLAVYVFRNIKSMPAMRVFSLAMIFAGGIGNIIDRILYDRHVTDFMNIGFGSVRTGIFNVADICVTAGVIGLLLFRQNKIQSENTSV